MTIRRIQRGDVSFNVSGGMDSEYREFWDWYESDSWEPDTVKVFERFLQPNDIYVDFGAWVGPTVLLAAKTASYVLCFEPDPIAREELFRNLNLNPDLGVKVSVFPYALAAKDGYALLKSIRAGGDSLSSLIHKENPKRVWTVQKLGVSSFLALPQAKAATFFKIDIEGSEYTVIPAMNKYFKTSRPSVYLALHPALLFDKTSVFARLTSGAYLLWSNWRLLRSLLTYKYHYVLDTSEVKFKNIRWTNLCRVLLPLPRRSTILIGSCLFTDEPHDSS